MKKIIAAAALALTLAVPVSAAGRDFQDVTTSHWAYNYVERAATAGWVSGVGNGRYEPESRVTGAEFVTMVTKSFYPNEVTEAQPGEPWYQGYVNTANNHGLLTHGMGNNAVLNAPITRYNMAAVLFNIADESGMLRPTSNGFMSADGSRRWSYSTAHLYIGDWASVPKEYQEAVLACYAMGLLSGNDAQGSFGGSSSMTRAEAAVVLCHTYDGPNEGSGNGDPTGAITQEDAKRIALEHAGLSASDVTFYRVYEDWENGRNVYEIEFYSGNIEYDYEIDKATGAIISYDSDIEGWAPSVPGGNPITLDQARNLVLAKVPGMTAQNVRIHQDWDDGRKIYEGEAWYNGVEYEFEIDASTGAFLDWSAERW